MKNLMFLILSVVVLNVTHGQINFSKSKLMPPKKVDVEAKPFVKKKDLEFTEITSLSENPLFQEYVENTIFLSNTLTNNDLLKKIYSDGKIDKKEIDIFVKLIGFNSKVDYANFVEKQNENLLIIKKMYNLNPENTTQLKQVLKKAIDKFWKNDFIGVMNPCADKYRNDLVINASVAVAGHLACAGLDITIIGGIICHGAVIAGQSAANSNARIDYLNCLK